MILTNYDIQSDELKNVIKMDQLQLCSKCVPLAQDADVFIRSIKKAKITVSAMHTPKIKLEFEEEIKNEIDLKEREGNIKIEIEDVLHRDDIIYSDSQDDSDMLYTPKLTIDLKDEAGTDGRNDKVEIIYLNNKELMNMREIMLADKNFLEGKYKCYDCVKFYAHEETYNKHMENHSTEAGDYKCEICNQRQKTAEKYDAHKKKHFRWYKCTSCPIMRMTREVIVQHYNSTHTDLKNDCYCSECNKWLKNSKALRKHNWYKHTGFKRIKCEYCDKELSDWKCIRTHILSKHPDKTSAPLPEKDHICLSCGKGFPTKGRLKAHTISHTNNKEFYCVECDKSFKSRSMLQAHLNSGKHTRYNDYRYVCEKCDKRYVSKRALDSHYNREHLKMRPFQCKECDKSFFIQTRLQHHVKIVHEGRRPPQNIPCNICNKLFRTKNTLREHLRTHTGERPYECKICGSKFTQSGVLRTHQKTVHLKVNRKTKLCEIDSKLL